MNNFKALTSSQRRHTRDYTIVTATFMDTRISTQSNTILIQETNLTFKTDKIIFAFYIRNDCSIAIIGFVSEKLYSYNIYVTCHVE